MSKKVLVSMPIEDRYMEIFRRQVEGTDCELIDRNNQDLRAEDVKDVDVIMGVVRPALLAHAEKLKWLQLVYAGADRYTSPKILKPEIILTNAAGAYDLAVAEHMLALTFALIRRFGEYIKNQTKHVWRRNGNISSVKGSTILILGAGRIGSDYARKVKALGASKVIGVRRTLHDKPDFFDEQYTIDALDGIIGRADIIAMVLPGGAQTNHIIDGEKISKMKDGVYLLNVGRGNAIEPAALKKFLKAGKFGGVGLDVTEPEPLPVGDELWDFDEVIITPHAAGNFDLDETIDAAVKICAENLGRWLKGEPLKNVVNRTVGY